MITIIIGDSKSMDNDSIFVNSNETICFFFSKIYMDTAWMTRCTNIDFNDDLWMGKKENECP